MTSTRLAIRKQMLDEDWHEGLYGTATAGAVGTLTDTTLLQVGGNATSQQAGNHLYRPAAATASDVYRRVNSDGYAPSTGVLTHGGPDWAVAPLASSDTGYYELWPWDPRLVNSAIDRALTTRCFSMQRDSVTTNGQSRYDVTASPFSLTITSPQAQIVEVMQVWGTDPNAEVHEWANAGKTWWPELDDGTLYVRFDPAPTGTLQIGWKKPYSALANDAASTACPIDYVAWAAYYELFIALEKRAIRRGEPEGQYSELKDFAYARYWAEAQKYLGRFAATIYMPRPRSRTWTPGPRMGRPSNVLGGAGGRSISGV